MENTIAVHICKFGENAKTVQVAEGSNVAAAVAAAGYQTKGHTVRRNGQEIANEAIVVNDDILSLTATYNAG